jgi:hypothetical protein
VYPYIFVKITYVNGGNGAESSTYCRFNGGLTAGLPFGLRANKKQRKSV